MKLILSERELAKLFAMLLLAGALFGITGLFGMLIMQWVTRQRFAKDETNKHGISQVDASRLGGVVITFLCLWFLIGKHLSGYVYADNGLFGVYWWGWFAFISTSAVGLIEDLDNDFLSPKLRISLLAMFFGATFLIWPEIIPNNFGYTVVDSIMAIPIISWLLTVIFCIGFINAINMADGANGLVPGIVFIVSMTYGHILGGYLWDVIGIVTGVFLIFNVISGRLFLGDAGAYGIGTILALASFYAINNGFCGIEFTAVLMCYPCIEIIFSMVRRKYAGRSIFMPDNYHLHNYLHEYLKKLTRSRVAANSLTGLIIATASSGIAFVGISMNLLNESSRLWGIVFAVQVSVYLFSYWLLTRPSKGVQPI